MGLSILRRLEELAARKASVYGRTLTDQTLAEFMQELAQKHTERGAALAALEGELPKENEKQGGEKNAN